MNRVLRSKDIRAALRSKQRGSIINPFWFGGGGGGGPTFTPVSGAADDFNRTNGALGSSWTDQGDFSATINVTIAGNGYHTGAGFPGYATWNGTGVGSLTTDHYVDFVLRSTSGTFTGGSDEAGVIVRSNGSTSCNCYRLKFVDGGNTILDRISANSVAATIDSRSVSWASGDTGRFGIIGSDLYVYRNGSLVYSVTDSNLTTGLPGIYALLGFHDTLRGDDVQFGNVT